MRTSSPLEKVTWGTPSFWIARLPLYWGIHKKFFEQEGIDLDLWYSNGGPELAQAVNAGRIHIGEMGLPPFLAAFRKGMPARIIGSSVTQQLDHYLASRADITAISDLVGRRIGILSAGSCDEYFIRHMFALHGIDADAGVRLVGLGEDYGKLDVFLDRRVDAAFVVEPQLSLGEQQGLLRVLGRVGDFYPRYQWGVILASDMWLHDRRELLERLLKAFRRSCRSIVDDPDGTTDLGGRVFGVPPEVFEHALKRVLPHWETNGRLDMAGLESALSIQKEMGVDISDVSLVRMVFQV